MKKININIIGRAKFKVQYLLDNIVLEAVIKFENREDWINYCYQLSDNSGKTIAGRCISVSKRTLSNETNIIEYLMNHAEYSINNFRINRKRVFQVKEKEAID